MTTLRTLHPGDTVRWQGVDCVILYAIGGDGEAAYEIDIGYGRTAIAFERELQREPVHGGYGFLTIGS